MRRERAGRVDERADAQLLDHVRGRWPRRGAAASPVESNGRPGTAAIAPRKVRRLVF